MEKNEILYKSFQVTLFKQMDTDNINFEVIYCHEVDEKRIYCDICDNICKEQFYKNHLESQHDKHNIRKKQQLKSFFYFN